MAEIKNAWITESGEYVAKTTPIKDINETIDSAEQISSYLAGDAVKISKKEVQNLSEFFDLSSKPTKFRDAFRKKANAEKFSGILENVMNKTIDKIDDTKEFFDNAKREFLAASGITVGTGLLTLWISLDETLQQAPDGMSPWITGAIGALGLAVAGRGAFKMLQAKREENKQSKLFAGLDEAQKKNEETIFNADMAMSDKVNQMEEKIYSEKENSQRGKERFERMQRDIEGDNYMVSSSDMKYIASSSVRDAKDWMNEVMAEFDNDFEKGSN